MGHELRGPSRLRQGRYQAVEKFMQYFFFEVRFQFEDFVPVSRIVHSNAVLHLNVLPLKKFHNNPPKNTPNYSEKLHFPF
jgi:hypothetical protein